MDEDFGLSEKQRNIILDIKERDNGFHSMFMLADAPFSAISEPTEDGFDYIKPNTMFTVEGAGMSYDVSLRLSDELTLLPDKSDADKDNAKATWFFTIKWGSERIDGILHFNTVYNAESDTAFAFLNDNPSDLTDDISHALAFTNLLVMRK